MTQTNDTTNTRDAAISRLAQAIDEARERGLTSWGIADALAVAMWGTHGIDNGGRGTNVELDDFTSDPDQPQFASGIDNFTDLFQQQVAELDADHNNEGEVARG